MEPASPDTQKAAEPAPGKSCLVQLIGGLYGLLMLAASAVILFAFADLHQSSTYRTPASDHWDTSGFAMGGLLLLTGVSALFYATKPARWMWLAALCFSFISLAGILQWLMAGRVMLVETQRRGGDWAGLNVISSGLFGLGTPLFLGAVTLAGIVCLILVRPAGQSPHPPDKG